MLGCMRRAFDLLAEHRGERLDLATIPPRIPTTYAMIRKADTIGVFQIESRAQMAMLPRLKPSTFYDLVIEVAIIRPGPIQGDMVHPYLRRREGKEKAVYPTPELERVLGKTLGVPLFQEQAMQVAIVCAGFTPSEADQLRRSMATFKVTGGIAHFKDKLIGGMVERRYTPRIRRADGFADRGVRQLRISGEPCGQLRADRLCLELDEVPPPGRVLLRAAERAADGVLRAGADRARCAGARRRGPAGLRQCQPLGLHAGADGRPVPGGAAGHADGEGPGERACGRDRRGAWRARLSARWTNCGAAPACRRPPCSWLAEADGFPGHGP